MNVSVNTKQSYYIYITRRGIIKQISTYLIKICCQLLSCMTASKLTLSSIRASARASNSGDKDSLIAVIVVNSNLGAIPYNHVNISISVR